MTPHSELNRLIALSDMGQEAKPRTQDAQDYERGVADCIKGVKHEDQSEAYNAGYGQECSYQMAVAGRMQDAS